MLRIGTFKTDCTPPEGYPIGFGVDRKPAGVRDPLYLRGYVLDDGETRCLVATLDYCGLMNSAYDELVEGLAGALDILPDRTVVHCVHQHDTPLINFEMEAHLGRETFPRSWWQGVVRRCAEAAGGVQDRMVDVGAVGHAETRLQGFASNRRILGADGKVRAMRFSRCPDPDLRALPAGVIDPMLRTLAFKDTGGRLLASLSFYATHPQVSNGRGMYSADAQGEAMRLLESSGGSAVHGYFSGPFGNVTAGKYSSPTDLEGNLLAFGRRLADGIGRNLNAMVWEAPGALVWRMGRFPFPRVELDREAVLRTLADERTNEGQKIVLAANMSCHDYPANATYPLRLLKVGSSRLVFLPGEPFVEYQIHVQSLRPDEFVAVAANCNDNFLYLPLAENFEEGGYEVTSFRWCTPEFEARFKAAVADLLA